MQISPDPMRENTSVTEGNGQKKLTREELASHHHVNYGNQCQILRYFLCEWATSKIKTQIKILLRLNWSCSSSITRTGLRAEHLLPTSGDNNK